MADQLSFEVAGAGEPTWSVAELNEQIRRRLAKGFPDEVWVRGEVQSLRRSRYGHTYFDLAEPAGGRNRYGAKLSVALLADAARWIRHQHVDEPDVELVNGLDVRIKGRVDYYGPQGQLQLQMSDLDPFFTVGALAAERARVLRRLHDEGVLAANGQVPMPPAPLRLGLVTSTDSAAYHDAIETLRGSGIAFQIVTVDARVQGRAAPTAVVRAIRTARRAAVDVVLVVRGGGSAADLAAFDDEAIARAIGECDVPVITGIGHEIDESVADHAAHHRAKTPTAAAEYVVAVVRAYEAGMETAWRRVQRRAAAGLSHEQGRVAASSGRVVRAGTAVLRAATAEVERAGRRLSGPGMDTVLGRQGRVLDERQHRLAGAAGRRVHTRSADVGRVEARLRVAVEGRLRDATNVVDVAADHVRLLDPTRLLRRGWTMTLGPDGRVVTDPSRLRSGDVITTRFASGRAVSEITGVELDAEPDGIEVPGSDEADSPHD